MKTSTYHLTGKFYGCDPKKLNNPKFIMDALIFSAQQTKLKIVKKMYFHHTFNGKKQGVSAVLIVEESHLSIYTFPEHNYALCDILTCTSETCTREAFSCLLMKIKPKSMDTIMEQEVL